MEIKGKYSEAIIFSNIVEETALGQILELCNQEWVKDSKIRIMPDVHAGVGCVIGTSMTILDKICPNLVGVDIGCGMLTVELGKININLEGLDKYIRNEIPSGQNSNETIQYPFSIDGLKCYKKLKNIEHIHKSLGSLGGGNHFIEIDEDTESNKYLIIHSGSRNLGKQVADIYQKEAIKHCSPLDDFQELSKALIAELKKEGRVQEISVELAKLKTELEGKKQKTPNHLAYLENEGFVAYMHDMQICQKYASINRELIANKCLTYIFKESLKECIADKFETIHNYIDVDKMTLRKGSVDASLGKKLLIPINMRDGCIIAEGLGNEEYNFTAPHGAGRIMSRSKAKEAVSLEEFEKSMKGIYTTSVNQSTIDESPMAYKPIDEIIENIQETVRILEIIKPIYNFKASE